MSSTAPLDSFAEHPVEPKLRARINEHRQAIATGELADESVPIAGGVANYAAGVEWVNHAILIGFDTDVSDADLDAMEAFYSSRNLPSKVEITTFSPESFLAQLARRCYVIEHFENVLTRHLRAGDDPFAAMPAGLPRGLTISRTEVGDDDACREHAEIVSSGFVSGPVPESHIAMTIRSMRHPRSVGFLARIEGKPAGACGMEVFEYEGMKACALWGTTVLEPFRRQGVQQALIAQRLAYAIEQGCSMAYIESKPGVATERNAARFGFGLCYVRMCMVMQGSPQAHG